MPNNFIIKNEKKIKELKGGLKKDNLDGKVRIDVIPYNMILRVAQHFTDGAKKYGMNNWKNATKDNYHIFLEAAMRHIWQWNEGMEDEDHAAAVIQNIMMYESKKKIKSKKTKVHNLSCKCELCNDYNYQVNKSLQNDKI